MMTKQEIEIRIKEIKQEKTTCFDKDKLTQLWDEQQQLEKQLKDKRKGKGLKASQESFPQLGAILINIAEQIKPELDSFMDTHDYSRQIVAEGLRIHVNTLDKFLKRNYLSIDIITLFKVAHNLKLNINISITKPITTEHLV